MSELKMKTIESLPLIEEPNENATIMGLKEGRAVQIPVGAVGGGTTGVVFTYEWDENASGVEGASIEPLGSAGGAYVASCSHSFDECYELILAGSPIVFIDRNWQLFSSDMSIEFGISSSGPKSVLTTAAPEGAYIDICCYTPEGNFYIEYAADYLYGYYGSGGIE